MSFRCADCGITFLTAPLCLGCGAEAVHDEKAARQAAVIAAVENWPGAEASEHCPAPRYIHLPVPKEACDDPR